MSSISIRVSPRFERELDKWKKRIEKEIKMQYPSLDIRGTGTEVTESLGQMMESGIIKPKNINILKNKRRKRKKITFEVEFPL